MIGAAVVAPSSTIRAETRTSGTRAVRKDAYRAAVHSWPVSSRSDTSNTVPATSTRSAASPRGTHRSHVHAFDESSDEIDDALDSGRCVVDDHGTCEKLR